MGPSLSISERIVTIRSILARESISSSVLEEPNAETIPSLETSGVTSGTTSALSRYWSGTEAGDELRGPGVLPDAGVDRVLAGFPGGDDLDGVPA